MEYRTGFLLNGQVYAPLWQDHRLVLPGGAKMMVETGGLWLGCGRGRLANVYGMTCEQMREGLNLSMSTSWLQM